MQIFERAHPRPLLMRALELVHDNPPYLLIGFDRQGVFTLTDVEAVLHISIAIPQQLDFSFLYRLPTKRDRQLTRILTFLATLIGAFLPGTGYYFWIKRLRRTRR